MIKWVCEKKLESCSLQDNSTALLTFYQDERSHFFSSYHIWYGCMLPLETCIISVVLNILRSDLLEINI